MKTHITDDNCNVIDLPANFKGRSFKCSALVTWKFLHQELNRSIRLTASYEYCTISLLSYRNKSEKGTPQPYMIEVDESWSVKFNLILKAITMPENCEINFRKKTILIY